MNIYAARVISKTQFVGLAVSKIHSQTALQNKPQRKPYITTVL